MIRAIWLLILTSSMVAHASSTEERFGNNVLGLGWGAMLEEVPRKLGIGFPIWIFGLVWLDVCQLGGYLVTSVAGAPHYEQVKGILKTQSPRATGCSRYVRLDHLPGHWGDSLCVSSAFFDAAPKAVVMKLYGKHSALGFRVSGYERQQIHPADVRDALG
jgi:hypothetical protein